MKIFRRAVPILIGLCIAAPFAIAEEDCDKKSFVWSKLTDVKANGFPGSANAVGYVVKWGVGPFIPSTPVQGKPGVRQWHKPAEPVLLDKELRLDPGVNSIEVTGFSQLDSSKTFYYRIYFYDAAGNLTPYSDEFTWGNPCGHTVPAAPGGLKVVPLIP